MWSVSQESQGQAEGDERLYQIRLLYLDNDIRLCLLHAGAGKALVVAAVYVRLGASSFRMKLVWE